MSLAVGETVVYPGHGAALIEAIETRRVKGEDTVYVVLRVANNDMVVRVPAGNLDLIGVREVINENGLDRVVATLRAGCLEDPMPWSRRYKANAEKLRSGQALRVAEVVRDLWRRERDRGVSTAERRQLTDARQALVSELALCNNTNEEAAGALLDEVLAS